MVTVDAVATTIGCSRGQAYNILHEGLGFHKVCSHWVPRQLTPQHKSQRMGLSLQHLQRHQDEGDDMLSRIVTGDESWVHHYEPETKRASMQWKHSVSPVHKKFKVTPSAVRAWFRQQPKEFYAAGFQGLVKRWDKCLNLFGDYVEIYIKEPT